MMNHIHMLAEDKLYDGKSLLFENGELLEVDDPRDKKNIPEGRLGEFAIEWIRTAMGVVLKVPVTKMTASMVNEAARVDAESIFYAEAENRWMALEKLDPESLEDRARYLAENADLASVSCEACRKWVGILTSPENRKMAGMIALVGGTGEDGYVLTYAGTGNFTDIKMEQGLILRSLCRSVGQ